MTNHRILQLLAACLTTLALSGTAKAEDLVIPGSGNPEYVLGQLAAAFNAQQTRHRVTVPPSSGTAGALRDVESGATALGRVGRALKDEERARGLVYLPLGRDPVTFVTGAAGTVRNITSAQAEGVFRGTVTDWSALGGKPGPIRAIGRETTDAARQAIGRHIKSFDSLVFGDEVKLVHLDPQAIELLDRYATSLGFLNRSGLAAAKTRLVMLALDGVEPTPQNLEAGKYPLWLEFGLVHKSGSLGGAAQAFVEFVRGPAGQQLLRTHGILPAPTGR